MLGNNLKILRDYYGESQEELAEKIGVAPATISHWESSFRKPKEKNLKSIAQHYGISVEELIKGDMSKCERIPIKYNKQSHIKYIETMFPIIGTKELLEDTHLQKGNRFYTMILQKCKENKDIDENYFRIACDEYYASWEKNENVEAVANLLSLFFLIISNQILVFKNGDKISERIRIKFNNDCTLGAEYFRRYFLMDTLNEQEQKQMEEMEEKRKKLYKTFGGTIDEYIRILKKKERWVDLGDYYMAMKFVTGMQQTSFDICLTRKIGRELMKTLAAQENPYASSFINL